MAKCEVCGKGPQFGHNVSFSMKRTKRQFRPNIQKVTFYEGGRKVRKHVCTRCVNFSCPLNGVPKHIVDDYLHRNPIMRQTWEAKGYLWVTEQKTR